MNHKIYKIDFNLWSEIPIKNTAYGKIMGWSCFIKKQEIDNLEVRDNLV